MQKKNYVQEILDIIHSGLPQAELAEKLSDYHENDLADALADLTAEERRKLYAILGVEQVAEIFSYLDDAEPYLKELPPEEAAQVVSHMDSDDAVDALDDLEEEDKEKIVHQMDKVDKDAADDVKLLLSYDEDEIGSRMSANFISLDSEMTVGQATRALMDQAKENDNIQMLFVTAENGFFCGTVELRALLIAEKNAAIAPLIQHRFPYVYCSERTEDCIERLKSYSESAIPVLDASNCILGVITLRDLVEAVDDEMSDDYAKLGGLSAEEDLHEPLRASLKKRMPWLLVLLVLGMVVSGVVGAFEKVVSRLTIIMAFQSLILDMAGNVGTQSLAVTIRVLMDKEITARKKLGLVCKEMRVGLFSGLILGSLSVLFVGAYIMLGKGYPAQYAFAVSVCIGAALLLAMFISSAVGTLIPMFFKRIGVDPAVASGPLITTVNDLVAVVTYYGLSWLLLLQVLHLGS